LCVFRARRFIPASLSSILRHFTVAFISQTSFLMALRSFLRHQFRNFRFVSFKMLRNIYRQSDRLILFRAFAPFSEALLAIIDLQIYATVVYQTKFDRLVAV
jgi:hypothetical protein